VSRITSAVWLGIAAQGLVLTLSVAEGTTPTTAGLHVDQQLEGDLLGDGQVYSIRWYHRGPLPAGGAYIVFHVCANREAELNWTGAQAATLLRPQSPALPDGEQLSSSSYLRLGPVQAALYEDAE
jgi:hypothetical protein